MHLGRNRRWVPLLTVYTAMGFGFYQDRIMGKIGHLGALVGMRWICEFHLSYFLSLFLRRQHISKDCRLKFYKVLVRLPQSKKCRIL